MKWQLYKTQLRDGFIRSFVLLALIGLLFVFQETLVGGFIILGVYGMFIIDFILTIKELTSRKFKIFGLAPVSAAHYVVPMVLRYLIMTFAAIFLVFTVFFAIIPTSLMDISQYQDLIPYISIMLAFYLLQAIAFYSVIVIMIRSTLVSGVQVAFIRVVSAIIIGFFVNYIINEAINAIFGFTDSLQYMLEGMFIGTVDTGFIFTLVGVSAVISLLYLGIVYLIREKYLDY